MSIAVSQSAKLSLNCVLSNKQFKTRKYSVYEDVKRNENLQPKNVWRFSLIYEQLIDSQYCGLIPSRT